MNEGIEGVVARRRRELEQRWGDWQVTSLAERFDQVADAWPARPCVLSDHGQYSYADMTEWSCRLARGLLARAVRPGAHVAVLIDNRPEFVAVKLAIARIGAVAVPLNYQYRAEELAAALSHSRAVGLVTISSSLATDFLTTLDTIAPGWERGVASPHVPDLQWVVTVEHAARDGATDLDELARQAQQVSESTLARRQAEVDPRATADVVFTSGTSGRPLSAELTHDMLLRSAYGSAYTRAFADGWRVSFALPLYHIFGYVEGLLASLFVAGAIVPRHVFNPRTMLAAIDQHRANEALFVPTMTVATVEEAAARPYDLSSLESVMSAAAPAPVWLWERVSHELGPRFLFTGYGQTEVSAATTLTQPGDAVDTVADTVGCPKLGGIAGAERLAGRLAEYRTLDPFTGAALSPGQEGELAVRGPIVTGSYYDNPERTRALIDAQGWLRTGDLGHLDTDGYLRLTGRSRELYKCGGELVAPQEVERVLTGHAGVAQAYVAGVPDERMGEVGWAWIVPDGTVALDDAALLHHCRQHLAPFKAPRTVVFTSAEELPTTTTGKVQKYRLVEQAQGRML